MFIFVSKSKTASF